MPASKWNPGRLNTVICQTRIIHVTAALFLIETNVLFVVLEMWPLRRTPIDRCHEIIVSSGDQRALLFCSPGLGLTAPRRRFESWCHIIVFFYALTDASEVSVSLHPAWCIQIEGPGLIPVRPISAN